jgi:hypothetical protein
MWIYLTSVPSRCYVSTRQAKPCAVAHRRGLNPLIFIVATLRNTSTNGQSKGRKCKGRKGLGSVVPGIE